MKFLGISRFHDSLLQ